MGIKISNSSRIIIAVLVFVFYAAVCSLRNFKDIRTLHWSMEINTFCHCNPEHVDCQVNPDLQFNRFIWAVTDGVPRKFMDKTFDMYANNSVKYTVHVPGYKWSHAIYTAWMTGMPATNYFGESVKGDHIIRSIVRGNEHGTMKNGYCTPQEKKVGQFRLRYVGPAWAWVYLTGGPAFAEQTYYDETTYADGLESNYREATIYPTLFPPGNLESVLDDVVNKGQSLIIHTGVFDKKNHFARPLLMDERDRVEELHTRFKKFADEHPDYLLVLSADHGIDNDGILHGDGLNGNIGWFIFHNERFGAGAAERQIDVVDVSPTVSKYLSNVDIPMGSAGIPQNFFPDNESRIRVLRQSLRQLFARTVKRELISEDEHKSRYENLLKSGSEGQIREYAAELKALMYSPERPFLLKDIMLNGMAMLALLALILTFGGLSSRWGYLLAFLVIAPAYFLMLFTWSDYKRHFHKNGFIYWTWFVIAVSFSVLFSLLKNKLRDIRHDSLLRLSGVVVCTAIASKMLTALSSWEDGFFHDLIGTAALTFILYRYLVPEEDEFDKKVVIAMGTLIVLSLNLKSALFFDMTFGFHILGLPIYGFCGYWTYKGMRHRSLPYLIVSSCVFVGWLKHGDFQLTLLVAAFVHPFAINYSKKEGDLLSSTKTFSRLDEDKKKYSILSRLLGSAMILTLPYALFSAAGRTFDLDVQVEAGAVGVKNWNMYPTFSGLLMGLEKYGSLFLGALLISYVSQSNGHNSSGGRGSNQPKNILWPVIPLMQAFFVVIAMFAFNITLCVFCVMHSLDEALITILVHAIITFLLGVWSLLGRRSDGEEDEKLFGDALDALKSMIWRCGSRH
eukprot:TRINITY_DN1740_c0_g1_i1.p1 TRINITY_DN1740_c0_g1~~TRINITY_DN1740_c0_g1_i1.p1  ORF type:complete len:845 (-),score=185.66 TRINITY_DN1740_c0_g1_i1:174-2708(-)